jgi:ribonuclease BN (tRNA processing enzyme)
MDTVELSGGGNLLGFAPMRVLILGVGDAFSRLHFGSSALIEGPRGLVLLDCPDPIHHVIHAASEKSGWAVEPADIHDIIITHLHGDHCNGLESFGFARWVERAQSGRGERPKVHCWRPVAARLWERLAPAMDMADASGPHARLEDYFELCILEPDEPTRIAGLDVRCRPTRHPVPTVGLIVSDGEGALGWSADTPFDAEHLQWLSQASVIVHECNEPPAHTSLRDLEALPSELKQRMRLLHLPDGVDERTLSIRPLREGEILEVRELVAASRARQGRS